MSCRDVLGKAIWRLIRPWNQSMDDFFNKKFFFKEIVFIYGCQMVLATNRISYTYIYNTASSKNSKFNNYPLSVGFVSNERKRTLTAHFTFLSKIISMRCSFARSSQLKVRMRRMTFGIPNASGSVLFF